jgi:hypothetical protein
MAAGVAPDKRLPPGMSGVFRYICEVLSMGAHYQHNNCACTAAEWQLRAAMGVVQFLPVHSTAITYCTGSLCYMTLPV